MSSDQQQVDSRMHESMPVALPTCALSLEDENKKGKTKSTVSSSTETAFHRSVPDHLIALNQPRDISEGADDCDDVRSLSSTDLFDPPRPPPSKTPLLDAAIKAKEQVKNGNTITLKKPKNKTSLNDPTSTMEELERSVPDFLLTLNQPSEKYRCDPSNHDEDEDEASLGAPEIFDPISPPPPKKPLLHAAIKAKEQQERMKMALKQAPLAAS